MIKANELRIGNWVKHYHEDNIIIWQIEGSELTEESFLLSATPIEFNAEMLLECGFEYDFLDEESTIKTLNLRVENDIFTVDRDSIVWFNESPMTNIHFIHQLQNLVLLLTGEELEINFSVINTNEIN